MFGRTMDQLLLILCPTKHGVTVRTASRVLILTQKTSTMAPHLEVAVGIRSAMRQRVKKTTTIGATTICGFQRTYAFRLQRLRLLVSVMGCR